MSKPNDGGQAFPFVADDDKREHLTVEWGMSLRSYYKAKAMQALIANGFYDREKAAGVEVGRICHIGAGIAAEWADAMILEDECQSNHPQEGSQFSA